LYEAIENPDSVITKLEQCKITLTEKLDTLLHLDVEILEQVEDDEVNDEIKQADVCCEKIQVAIIDATTVIEGRKSRQNPPTEVFAAKSVEVNSGEVSAGDVTDSTTAVTGTTVIESTLTAASTSTQPMMFCCHHPPLMLILLVGHTPPLHHLPLLV